MANLYQQNNVDSSQIRQHGKLFIPASKFNLSGAATLTRGGKGNWYWAVAASQGVFFVAGIGQILRDYLTALINYTPNINFNSADLSLNGITAIYAPTGAALAAATAGVSQSTFTSASANPVVTDLIAPGNLLLPISANLVLATVNPTNYATLAQNPSEVLAEVNFTTAVGGALKFYGAIVDLNKSR